MTKKYGKTQEETLCEKNIQCREIVRTILDFGVDEYQKFKIIELLSLELENRDSLIEITSATKKYLKKDGNDDDTKETKLITTI